MSPHKDFVVKDSGERKEYESGMRRDTQEGKPRYDLISRPFLYRLAMHMTKGAIKYGDNNWQLANSEEELARFKASAFRHLMQWLNNEDDEDHMAAVAFNLAAAEWVKEKITKEPAWDDCIVCGKKTINHGNSAVDPLNQWRICINPDCSAYCRWQGRGGIKLENTK